MVPLCEFRLWFTFSSPPLPQPSTQEQSGLCQEREMTSGEGRGVSCATQHAGHLLSTHQTCGWRGIGVSVVTPRAFAWTHFPCLFFFFSYCSVLFIFILSAFDSPVPCLPPRPHPNSPAPRAHPDTVSQLLCSFPCCCVRAGWAVAGWTALGVETACPAAADIGLGTGEALVPE